MKRRGQRTPARRQETIGGGGDYKAIGNGLIAKPFLTSDDAVIMNSRSARLTSVSFKRLIYAAITIAGLALHFPVLVAAPVLSSLPVLTNTACSPNIWSSGGGVTATGTCAGVGWMEEELRWYVPCDSEPVYVYDDDQFVLPSETFTGGHVAVSSVQSIPDGRFRSALRFTGSGSAMYIPDGAGSGFTVSLWARLGDLPAGETQTIIQVQGTGQNVAEARLMRDELGYKLISPVYWYDKEVRLTNSPIVGTWTQLALVFSNHNVRCWIDGAPDAEFYSAINDQWTYIRIAPDCALDCDEVRVHAVPLRAEQLASLGDFTSHPLSVRYFTMTNGTCPRVVTRVWQSRDLCGDWTQAERRVTLTDVVPPVLLAPSNRIIPCNSREDTGTATGYDECSPAVAITWSDVTNAACPYRIFRRWTAEDECGNQSSATQTIDHLDDVPPQIFPPPDLWVGATSSVDPTITGYAIATDNCPGTVSITFSDLETLPMTISRLWRAVDGCGQQSVVTQMIHRAPTAGLYVSAIPSQFNVPLNAIPDRPSIIAADDCAARWAPTNGLILYLNCDQNPGPVFSENSSFARSLRSSNVVFSATEGIAGGYYSFNGSNSFIRVPLAAHGELNSTAFTWSVWARSREMVPKTTRGILGKHVAHEDAFYHLIQDDRFANASVVPNSPFEIAEAIYSGSLLYDRWCHVAFSYDGVKCRLYLDGHLVTSGLQPGYAGNTNDILIGASEFNLATWQPQRFWRGDLDEIRFYQRVLHEDEIAALAGVPEVKWEKDVVSSGCPEVVERALTVSNRCGQTSRQTQTIRITDQSPPFIALTEPSMQIDCGDAVDPSRAFAVDSLAAWTRKGLVAHYTFDELIKNRMFDASGQGHSGAISNVTVGVGFDGQAGIFNGDGAVIFGTGRSLSSRQYTVSGWFYADPLALHSVPMGLMGLYFSDKPWSQMSMVLRDGTIVATVSQDGYNNPHPAMYEGFGNWAFVALTFDGSQARFYINGDFAGSMGVEQFSGQELWWSIGSSSFNPSTGQLGPGWKGRIDECRLYRRALSDGEIRGLYWDRNTASTPTLTLVTTGQVCAVKEVRMWSSHDLCGSVTTVTQTIERVNYSFSGDVDRDGDGLDGRTERLNGTDPYRADTDGDGRDDRVEISRHYDPLAAYEFPPSVQQDFDGDGMADLNVYWPFAGNWYVRQSRDGGFLDGAVRTWGGPTAQPAAADFDADAKSDISVYVPQGGQWFVRLSSSGRTLGGGPVPFGSNETLPVPGDYDGDGKGDLAVYEPRAGQWYIAQSTEGFRTPQWGWSECLPVAADYDGDGRTDVAVYHPAGGMWYILQSSDGRLRQQQWGWYEAEPMPLDYDGDGKTDIAVYHPNSGNWYVLKTSNGLLRQRAWGWRESLPVTGDFDGGGKSDLAVYDPATGRWYIRFTETGDSRFVDWGWSEALPTDNQLRINRFFGFPR